jgi:uncharacterized membrane protein
MPFRKAFGFTIFALFCLAGDSARAQSQVATEWSGGNGISLGGLPSFTSSSAQDINNLGQAVGYSVVEGVRYATEWSGGRVINLGVGEAAAVNDIGQVVGESGGLATEWSGGRVITLGRLPGTTSSIAYGINNAGEAVGYSIVGGVEYATEWNGGKPISLRGLTGSAGSSAYGINDAGQVVGVVFFGGSARAIEWTGGKPAALGGLSGLTASGANVINDAGKAAGGIFVRGVDLATEWSGGKPNPLSSLNSVAFGVNDRGIGTPDFHRIGTPLAGADGSARPGEAGWGCAAGASVGR